MGLTRDSKIKTPDVGIPVLQVKYDVKARDEHCASAHIIMMYPTPVTREIRRIYLVLETMLYLVINRKIVCLFIYLQNLPFMVSARMVPSQGWDPPN